MYEYTFIVDAEQAGTRLDIFVAKQIETLTRSAVQNLLNQEKIFVNEKTQTKNYKLREGDTVFIEEILNEPLDVLPENIPLDIIYEDDSLLIVNKPKGMVVHPGAGNTSGTLVNALLYHCAGSLSGINGVVRPGIVHRIDKDTSGLLMVAKTNEAHLSLAKQLAEHTTKRIYHAVVYGTVKENEGTVNAPIGRSTKNRLKMALNEKNSKHAVTHYEVLEWLDGFSYLSLQLETGRTHQIRVHMASLHHPLAGDTVYGPKKVIKELQGQCLHAKCIGFIHPVTGEYMEFDSELPTYFQTFLEKHRRNDIL